MIIGVYGGSFNPVHRGHIALADYLVQEGFVDEVWLIRSPLNPLKQQSDLMSNEVRQQMLEIAIEGHPGLKISTVEDQLPQPNYSITTLRVLQQMHPEHEFHLIIGKDNWDLFNRWRDHDVILRDFHVLVYPRTQLATNNATASGAAMFTQHVRFANDAPLFNVSSTEVRVRLKQGLPVNDLVDERIIPILMKNI